MKRLLALFLVMMAFGASAMAVDYEIKLAEPPLIGGPVEIVITHLSSSSDPEEVPALGQVENPAQIAFVPLDNQGQSVTKVEEPSAYYKNYLRRPPLSISQGHPGVESIIMACPSALAAGKYTITVTDAAGKGAMLETSIMADNQALVARIESWAKAVETARTVGERMTAIIKINKCASPLCLRAKKSAFMSGFVPSTFHRLDLLYSIVVMETPENLKEWLQSIKPEKEFVLSGLRFFISGWPNGKQKEKAQAALVWAEENM